MRIYIFCIISFFFNILHSQITDFKNINFKKADSIALKLKNEKLYDLKYLSCKLTDSLENDIEKFRAIYIWVCTNIENDNYIFQKNARKREKFKNDSLKLYLWNKKISNETFQKLINDHKTVCSGYAYLIKELSNLANIKCEIINGFGRTTETNFITKNSPNHSWNAVKLNSKWYLCDATWSSGFFDENKNSFYFDYNNGYFLTNPYEFIYTHYPTDKKWTLINYEITLEEFSKFPLVYPEGFKYGIFPNSPFEYKIKTAKNKKLSFQFKSSKKVNLDNFTIELISNNTKTILKPEISYLSDSLIELKLDFIKTGLFDLNIKYNEDYLCTYSLIINN